MSACTFIIKQLGYSLSFSMHDSSVSVQFFFGLFFNSFLCTCMHVPVLLGAARINLAASLYLMNLTNYIKMAGIASD